MGKGLKFLYWAVLLYGLPCTGWASCVEKWYSKDYTSVAENRCRKHKEGLWLYSSQLSWSGYNKKSIDQDVRFYYKHGQDVYIVYKGYENSCQFSTGDASGMGVWLTTPRCWFGNHRKDIFEFRLVTSKGDSFTTLYQRYSSNSPYAFILKNYSVDEDNVYYGSHMIEGADPQTFRVLLQGEELEGVELLNIAIDSKGIYVNNERISSDKWYEMKHVPIGFLNRNDKVDIPFYIKMLSNSKGFYLFSMHGYARVSGFNIKNMDCNIDNYLNDIFCKVNNELFKLKPDFQMHTISLESIQNRNM